MIQLKNIRFAYRPNLPEVLRDISLSIKAGEDICLMGSNGSGKSTLVRLIAGLLKPTSGEISWRSELGRDSKVVTGFLFQNPDNQMVAMTGAKEVAFALENKAVAQTEMNRRVTMQMDSLDIGPLAGRLTNELSGGEKQRLALASVLVDRPELLILDEPHSFLDAEGRRRLDRLLINLRKEYPSMVIIRVTQYESVARRHPRLIMLTDGRVTADTDPNQLLPTNSESISSSRHQPVNRVKVGQKDTPHQKISLKAVSCGYETDQPIIEDISLTIRAGERVALIGPTGSGKSTLGLLLSGLKQPLSGQLEFTDSTGQILAQPKPGMVGAIFQMPERQFFLPTVTEEIIFGPKNVGRPLSETQIDEQFRMVGLDRALLGQRDPFSLSVGEKRRLAFACVLSMQPLFVIFDEPTAALDSEGWAMFVRLSDQLKEAGVGQLLISHERPLVEALADRILCLVGDKRLREYTINHGQIDDSLAEMLAG